MPVTTAQTASGSAPFRPKPSAPHRHINLLRGWPAASLLPAEDIAQATSSLLVPPFSSSLEGTAVDLEKNIAAEKEKERKDVVTDLLEYGPDLGFGPLRDEVAQWLTRHFSNPRENERKTVIASMEKTTVSIPESAAARICITGGASQNLANVLLSFSDPEVTRAVWLIRPVYFLACPIFEDAGFGPGRLHGVPEDEEGVNIGWLRTRLERFEEEDRQKGKIRVPLKPLDPLRRFYRHLIYCVPSSSNPSGKTMSLRRRRQLVHLAREFDALIICDDVYDMLQWKILPSSSPSLFLNESLSSSQCSSTSPSFSEFPEARRLPRLVDIDRELGRPENLGNDTWFGNTLSNGSFSKLVSPGMRTGWCEGVSSALPLGLSRTGATRSGGAPSQFSAAVIWNMLKSGVLDQHVHNKVRPALQQKHALLIGEIYKAREEGVKWEVSGGDYCVDSDGKSYYGGYFVWVRLPPGMSADDVSRTCMEDENLTVASGNLFNIKNDCESANTEAATKLFDGYVRLCFAWEEEDAVCEGVKRLARVVKKLQVS